MENQRCLGCGYFSGICEDNEDLIDCSHWGRLFDPDMDDEALKCEVFKKHVDREENVRADKEKEER